MFHHCMKLLIHRIRVSSLLRRDSSCDVLILLPKRLLRAKQEMFQHRGTNFRCLTQLGMLYGGALGHGSSPFRLIAPACMPWRFRTGLLDSDATVYMPRYLSRRLDGDNEALAATLLPTAMAEGGEDATQPQQNVGGVTGKT